VRSPGDLKLAVKKGIFLLDEKVPGWREKIDVAELDMTSPCHCILGQVTGDYFLACEDLSLEQAEAVELGFDCSHASVAQASAGECEHDPLQALWLAELT